MAIVNSLAIGKSVKSAGNLTYKTVRGRTIASQRITQNKSNTLLQQIQRSGFALASKCITLCQSWIDISFEKSKYGSARNNFFKLNPLFRLGGDYSLVVSGAQNMDVAFLKCFENYENNKKRQLNYLSYGSASCVVIEKPATAANVNIGKSGLNKVRYTSSLDLQFPSGVSADRLKLYFVYFLVTGGNAMMIGEINFKSDDTGKVSIDWENSDQNARALFENDSTVSGNDGIISNLSLEPFYEVATITSAFFVPIVDGRIARTTLPFIDTKNMIQS